MNLTEQLKEAQSKVLAFEGQVKDLTVERDTLSAQVKDLGDQNAQSKGLVDELTAERDQLTDRVAAVEAERETALEQVAAAQKECKTLKAQLALSPGHKDLSAGTNDGESGLTGSAGGNGDDGFMKAYRAAAPAERRKMWLEKQKGGFMRLGAMMMVLAMVCFMTVFASLATASRNYDQVILETPAASTGAVATVVSDKLVGAIESVTIIVAAGATVDVAVATADISILTKTGATGTETYYPRATVHSTTGVADTNGVVDRIVVVDTVKASYTNASTTNKAVRTLINFQR